MKLNISTPDIESTKALIRKRHGLADDAPVEVKTFTMEPSTDGDPFAFKARITTDTVDRDFEVLVPQGCDSSEFEKSGTVFWNHNYNMPVAKANGKLVRGDRWIDSSAKFAFRPADYQGEFFPDFARAMVNQGIVKGVSVGFMPIESRKPTQKDFETYGKNVGRVTNMWKLLEWSIAPLQCNPDALIRDAVGKGIITADAAKSMFDIDPEKDLADEGTDDADEAICSECGANYEKDDEDDDGMCEGCAVEDAKGNKDDEDKAAEPEPKRMAFIIDPPPEPEPDRVAEAKRLISGTVAIKRGAIYIV